MACRKRINMQQHTPNTHACCRMRVLSQANDRTTAERDLSIARYAVIPLSPNSGLIGWVPNCDTLHALIREYRCAALVCTGRGK